MSPSTYPKLIRKPQPWTEQAACAEYVDGEDWWHPEGLGLAVKSQEKHAKEVCAVCPVRLQCLQYALELDATTPYRAEGVWGGLNGAERDLIRKRTTA